MMWMPKSLVEPWWRVVAIVPGMGEAIARWEQEWHLAYRGPEGRLDTLGLSGADLAVYVSAALVVVFALLWWIL